MRRRCSERPRGSVASGGSRGLRDEAARARRRRLCRMLRTQESSASPVLLRARRRRARPAPPREADGRAQVELADALGGPRAVGIHRARGPGQGWPAMVAGAPRERATNATAEPRSRRAAAAKQGAIAAARGRGVARMRPGSTRCHGGTGSLDRARRPSAEASLVSRLARAGARSRPRPGAVRVAWPRQPTSRALLKRGYLRLQARRHRRHRSPRRRPRPRRRAGDASRRLARGGDMHFFDPASALLLDASPRPDKTGRVVPAAHAERQR